MADDKPVLLCVDADDHRRETLRLALASVDVELITAASGKEGSSVLESRQVDVLVAGAEVPGMSAQALADAAAEARPFARRLLLTEDAEGASDRSAGWQVVATPWDDDELREVVTSALARAKLEREHAELTALAARQQEEFDALSAELEARVARRTEELEHANGMLESTLRELEETRAQMVDLVANIAAMPHPECESARRKVRLALAIGEALGLDAETLVHLRDAVRLHRLGLVGLPEQVVSTPVEELSDAERQEFERHPTYAEAVLLSVPRLRKASEIVASQHEAWKGGGFPQKRVGEGIPLPSRILAVARDYYDLVSGRMLARKLTPAKAVERIVAGADDAYDPAVVKAFATVVKTVEELDVTLDEIAVQTFSLLPGMRLARDLATDEGVVLLARGTTLTENTIGTLINLERRSDQELSVYVMNDRGKEG